MWPGAFASSPGATLRQRSVGVAQRAAKAQPRCARLRLGTMPGNLGEAPRRARRAGAELRDRASRPAYRDGAGGGTDRLTGASSTLRPAYITIDALGDLGDHAEVVGDQDDRRADRRLRSSIRSRICAWMVTSSAVVGSSAISSFGIARERHRDHHPLAHAAGQLVRIFAQRAARARGCRPGRASRRARASAACSVEPLVTRRVSAIWSPTVSTGLSASSAPGRSC